MIRLLGSELLRFRSRRLVVVLFAGAIIGSVVACVIAGVNSHPPTAAARAAARAQADDAFRACMEGEFGPPDQTAADPEAFCRDVVGDETQYLPPHLVLAELPEILQGVASLTSILGLVVGASFVAVSWQTGTIGTILTWEPRRLRWFGSRSLVLGMGVFVMTAAMLAFLGAALVVTAAIRGSTILPDGWWSDVVATVLRVSVAAAIASLIGGAIASVGRHTSAALAAVFVWVAVLEGLVRGLRPLWAPWLLGDNMVTFVSWARQNFQVSEFESYTITPTHAVVVIGLYTAVLLGIGCTFVRARDVQ